jgi:hypothetical protein
LRCVFEGQLDASGEKVSCEGKGKQTFSNGHVFEGEFRDNRRNGPGKYLWPSGDTHEGEYRNNLQNGPGIYCWNHGPDAGERYEG